MPRKIERAAGALGHGRPGFAKPRREPGVLDPLSNPAIPRCRAAAGRFDTAACLEHAGRRDRVFRAGLSTAAGGAHRLSRPTLRLDHRFTRDTLYLDVG